MTDEDRAAIQSEIDKNNAEIASQNSIINDANAYVDENGDSVRILADSTSRNMQMPRSYEGDEHFGLGLLETEMFSPGTVLVGHCAGAYGMRGVMHFNPQEKYGFIVMSNGAHDTLNGDENMIHFGTIRRMFKYFIGEPTAE